MSTRLWRFQFSTEISYVIEVGHDDAGGYFRFYVQGGQIVDGSGLPYEITHPYAAADIADLYPKQINDVIYVCHPDYPVGKLARISNDLWAYSVVEFDTVPTLDENLTDITITASGTTGTISLLASDAIFQPEHVGAYWRLGYKRTQGQVSVIVNASIDSNGYVIYGRFNVRTYGIWSADIVLQRKDQTGGWETVKRWVGASDRNIDVEHEAEQPETYRLSIQNYVTSTGVARAVLEWGDAVIFGTVKITAVGSGSSATAEVTEELFEEFGSAIETIGTPYWAEGAWSDYRGYPRAVTCHETRLIFGGTYYQPATIWGSQIDDFENFDRGNGADDESFAFQLAGDETNAIQWLESMECLVIGTMGGEWRGVGDEYGAAITPTKRNFKQRTFFGSEHVPALKVGDSTLIFVEYKGRKIRELYIQGDQFQSADLTLLDDEVANGGVVQMAWQREQRVLWVVNGDGELFGLTYEREQQVSGWHGPHTTAGTYQSVATTYGERGANDEVWVIVQRTMGSTVGSRIERMNPERWEDIEDAVYVDSAITYRGSPQTSFTGATHLAEQQVVGLADGVPFEALVDPDGNFDLPSGTAAASVVHVGLPYTSEMQPFRLDIDAVNGVYAGKVRRVDEVKVRVLKTAGGQYLTPDSVTPRALEYPSNKTGTGLLKSGDIATGFKSGHEHDPAIIIRQSQPLPMTLLALLISASLGE